MEQKGGCCIARYSGGGGIYNDMSKVDRIMLRFRPIAPKPLSTNATSLSGGSTSPENSEPSPKTTGRGKRRKAATKDSASTNNKRSKTVKTLSLLPEVPEVKESSKVSPPFTRWLSFGGGGDRTVEIGRKVVVRSWVKVTWVGDGCGWYGGGLGCSDQERVMGLDRDTCPGFVSDGLNSVRWMNEAYRKMVVGGGGEEVVASILMEEGVVVPVGCAAFTCRVRVVTCGKENKGCGTVPCDVWRMGCGGFAWRLDTKAALSLGW